MNKRQACFTKRNGFIFAHLNVKLILVSPLKSEVIPSQNYVVSSSRLAFAMCDGPSTQRKRVLSVKCQSGEGRRAAFRRITLTKA